MEISLSNVHTPIKLLEKQLRKLDVWKHDMFKQVSLSNKAKGQISRSTLSQ